MSELLSTLARGIARIGLAASLAAGAGPAFAAGGGGGHGGGMGGGGHDGGGMAGGGRGGGMGGLGGPHGGDVRIRGGRAGGSPGALPAAARGLGGDPGRVGAEESRAYAGPEGDRLGYAGARVGRRELRRLAEREYRLRTSRCDRNITERYNAPHSCNDSPPLGRFPSAVGDDGF